MRLLTVAIALSLAAVSYADIITLKNGRIINGTYLGGTPRQIKVEVGDNIQTIDIGDIARIEFSGAGSTSSRDIPRDTSRDDGRPTLRRADSDSGSSSGSSSGSGSGGYGSGSGAPSSRPVILQPDPNDTGSYPLLRGRRCPSDNSRPTLRARFVVRFLIVFSPRTTAGRRCSALRPILPLHLHRHPGMTAGPYCAALRRTPPRQRLRSPKLRRRKSPHRPNLWCA